MLLRRITIHVKEQNWFAVLLDLLIVVFGVFIGIQVSNWNQELEGKKRAEVLLGRLAGDLKNDHKGIESVIDYYAVVRHYAVSALNDLNGSSPLSDKQFLLATYQASQMNSPWAVRATYAEMQSTGHINLIDDEVLKSKISGYYAYDFSIQQIATEFAPYREIIRGAMPLSIQEKINDQCGDIFFEHAQTFAAKLPEGCDLIIDDQLAKEAASELRSKSAILFDLRYQVAYNDALSANLSLYSQESQKLLNDIRQFNK